MSFVQNASQSVADAATGAGSQLEFPDAGEITDIEDIGFFESFVPTLKAGLSFSADGKANVLADHFKDDPRMAGAFSDKFGNPLIVWNGKPFYTNKPGFSATDANDVLGGAAMFTPAGRVAGVGGNMLGRAALALPAYTATDIARQYSAQGAGSGEDVSLGDAGTAGGVGAVAEAFVPPALRMAGRLARSAIPKKGAASIPGPASDASRAAPGILPDGIPLTTGQKSRNLAQLREEEAARQGSRGESAERTFQQFDQRQTEAIDTAAGILEKDIGSGIGLEPGNVTPMGARLQDDLIDAATQSKSGVRTAYDAANASQASLNPSAVVNIASDLAAIPKAMNLPTTEGMTQLNALMKQIDRFKALGRQAKLKPVDIQNLEAFRQSINAGLKSAQGGEFAALVRMKSTLDDGISDAIDAGLMNGDEATIGLFKKARELRTIQARLFEGKDAIGKKMTSILDRAQATPAQVVNYLVNLNKVASQHVTKGLIDRMVKVFGAGSEQIKLLKSAYLMKAFGEPLANKPTITARNAVIGNARSLIDEDGKVIADVLFSPAERQRIVDMANDVARTLTPADARNSSRSAWAFTRELVNRGLIPALAGKMGNSALKGAGPVPFVGPMVSAYRNSANRNAAEIAISGIRKSMNEPLVSAGVTAAALAAQEPLRIEVRPQ